MSIIVFGICIFLFLFLITSNIFSKNNANNQYIEKQYAKEFSREERLELENRSLYKENKILKNKLAYYEQEAGRQSAYR